MPLSGLAGYLKNVSLYFDNMGYNWLFKESLFIQHYRLWYI